MWYDCRSRNRSEGKTERALRGSKLYIFLPAESPLLFPFTQGLLAYASPCAQLTIPILAVFLFLYRQNKHGLLKRLQLVAVPLLFLTPAAFGQCFPPTNQQGVYLFP